MQKKPARNEFISKKDRLEVVHVPTGARYWADRSSKPSERSVVAKHEGNLDGILTNGDEYDTEEVQTMAESVLREADIA